MNEAYQEYIARNLYTDDDEICFDSYDQLTYTHIGDGYVELYVDDFFICILIIGYDEEMDDREFLSINDEVCYLEDMNVRS